MDIPRTVDVGELNFMHGRRVMFFSGLGMVTVISTIVVFSNFGAGRFEPHYRRGGRGKVSL